MFLTAVPKRSVCLPTPPGCYGNLFQVYQEGSGQPNPSEAQRPPRCDKDLKGANEIISSAFIPR